MRTASGTEQVYESIGAEPFVVPMIIRGDVIEDNLIEYSGRGESVTFFSPDPAAYVDRLPLSSPTALRDLYDLTFDEILDFLEELGRRLDVESNQHMQLARDLTYATAARTKPLVDNEFASIPSLFNRDRIREKVDRTIGLAHLNGWVESKLLNGTVIAVRAFGVRALHVVPGNGSAGAAHTIIRSAVTRSDSIIKVPSNNPFSAGAIGRTMCEMAPDHPITRHIAIAYWKGGDESFERRIFQPHNISKIVAWGGFASVKHVTKYIQPGLELISLDPKVSAAVVSIVELRTDQELHEAALRIAVDVGVGNQTACSSCRTVYVVAGGGPDAFDRTIRLAHFVYEELLGLPDRLSTKPKAYDPELRAAVETIRLQDDWFSVVGGYHDEGSVIVSRLPDPVDFASRLADRTVNIVPVESLDEVFPQFDSYTQTVGVYPENLKRELVEVGALYGVQRFVSLGYSADHTGCAPHDGLELERRLCNWVVDQRYIPIPLALAGSPDRVEHPERMPGTLEAVRAK